MLESIWQFIQQLGLRHYAYFVVGLFLSTQALKYVAALVESAANVKFRSTELFERTLRAAPLICGVFVGVFAPQLVGIPALLADTPEQVPWYLGAFYGSTAGVGSLALFWAVKRYVVPEGSTLDEILTAQPKDADGGVRQ